MKKKNEPKKAKANSAGPSNQSRRARTVKKVKSKSVVTKKRQAASKSIKDYTPEELSRMDRSDVGRLYAEAIFRNLNTHDPHEI